MTAETLTLRDYQQETVDAVYAGYGSGLRRLAAVLPTGGGKTVVFAKTAVDCARSGRSALVLAHREELTDQAEEKLRRDSRGLRVGMLQGRRREFDADLLVASVLTATRPGALNVLCTRPPGLVIVDECHHVAARSYQTILRELGCFTDTGPLVLGVTATLNRHDGLALGDTFQDVAHTVPIERLIADGYLLPPRGIRVKVEGLDFSRVRASRTSQTGLDDKAVAQAMSDALAPAAIARAVLEHGKGRHGVAFLPSVELSKEQARVFAEHGLRSIHVDGDTPKAVRKEIFRRARLGEYDMVCNVGIATEGTDVPIWDLVVLGRPTSSEVLFQQMAGRGLRPYPGQRDCLVLDVVGITGRHRLRTLKDLGGAPAEDELDDDLLQFDEDAEPGEQGDTEGREGPADAVAGEGADGPLVHELVDLFSASHTAWQRSPRGVWYLPAGDGRAVFLAPAGEVDSYNVGVSDGGPPDWIHLACDLTAAMGWGDKEARNIAKRDLDRGAEWRQAKLKRVDRVRAIYAGAATTDDLVSAGSLADAQDAAWAARHIDTLSCVSEVSPWGYWTR